MECLRLAFGCVAPVAGHVHGHGIVADQLPYAGAAVTTAGQITDAVRRQKIRVGIQKPLKRRGARLGHSNVNPEHLCPTCNPSLRIAVTIRYLYAGFGAAWPVSNPAVAGHGPRGARHWRPGIHPTGRVTWA